MSRLVRLALASILVCATVVPITHLSPVAVAAESDADKALATLNAYRKSKGLGAVKMDSTLTKMAQQLADACVKAKGKCDHNTGGSFADRLRKAGAKAGYGAENLYKNADSVEAAFAWWKASKIHNSNMLIPQVTKLGFARSPASGKGYWVLIVTDAPN